LEPKLLYLNPSTAGGLADYAHEQANALVSAGITVKMLTPSQSLPRATSQYEICPILDDSVCIRRSRLVRKASWVKRLLKNFRILKREIQNGNYQVVLLGSYIEYLAPLWAGQFRALAIENVKFGAIVHDPVRDYVVGPLWWHRRSIAAGYSFLQEAFVHNEIKLDTVYPMPGLRTTVIPCGPFHFPEPTQSRAQARKKLSIPDDAFVLLSFGHIRDGKNLDLMIQAMVDLPPVYLIVSGKEQSSGQKPMSYYQNLAQTFGVNERCRWIHGHVPENEVGNLFVASDFILLIYSKAFRSASGVLNTAVTYRKPCVASCGGGNLRSVVEYYGMGWFVEPDNLTELKSGILKAMHEEISPRWDAYKSENSWQRNAQLVKEKMFDSIS
jgi:glycosyltransferase involved in cell wall biosynthesis